MLPLSIFKGVMASALKSKSEVRLAFFELLFEGSEGYLCIFLTDPKVPKTGVSHKFFEWPRESLKVENFIIENEVHKNVYFCVNLLSKRERKKQYCIDTDLVWADLDEVNPMSIDKLPPPIVIQSSPGRWQAFWRLTSKLKPYDAERYSKRIAYAVEADTSGWDLTQLFRVPMTKNFKYQPPGNVKLERALTTRADPALFESALAVPPEEAPIIDRPLPESANAEEIIGAFSTRLEMDRFMTLYAYEPQDEEDWSKQLWALYMMLYRAGMSAEEVFIVAKEAKCNKFERDGRPVEHLWRDVLKANDDYGNIPPEKSLLEMPQLVGEPASETFIDTYKDWAAEATDAITEFHELSCFVILSAIVAASLRLEASYGQIAPNIWGLILGDSTVTRKSTAMKMAVDLISPLESDLILATDGSVEGLLSGLANRPNKVSVFFRDEVSGLFDSMNKRDYLSSMPETLAHLYDVPPIYSRLLRKEVIRIESPAFVFFGGGITERVYQNISEEWIESGFMPRFMVVAGEYVEGSLRPTGPPTKLGIEKRYKVTDKLADIFQSYATEVPISVGGEKMMMPPRIMVRLTDGAWTRYQDIEGKLTIAGYESLVRNTALPTFERMARSILKMGMILAATRQEPEETEDEGSYIIVNEDDIINAAWYAQNWGKHSIDLILNAGKAPREKFLDRVYRKIARDPGIFRSTIMQHLHLSKREMDDVIGTLEDRNQITIKKYGRGVRYWVV
jgi:hypothetical protein